MHDREREHALRGQLPPARVQIEDAAADLGADAADEGDPALGQQLADRGAGLRAEQRERPVLGRDERQLRVVDAHRPRVVGHEQRELIGGQRPGHLRRDDEREALEIALLEVGQDAVERLGRRVVADRLGVLVGGHAAPAGGDEQRVVGELLARGAAHGPARRVDGDDGPRRRWVAPKSRATRASATWLRRPRANDSPITCGRETKSARGVTSVTRTRCGASSESAISASRAATPPPAMTTCARCGLHGGHATPGAGQGRPRHPAVGIRGNPQASRSLERADRAAAGGRRDADPHVDDHRALRPDDDRIAVQLGHGGQVLRERAHAAQDVLDRREVGRRRPAVPREQRERPQGSRAAPRRRARSAAPSRTATSARSSAVVPPAAQATTGPNCGSAVTPDEQLDARAAPSPGRGSRRGRSPRPAAGGASRERRAAPPPDRATRAARRPPPSCARAAERGP